MIQSSYVEPIKGMPTPLYPYIAKYGSIILLVTGLGHQADELSGMVISSSSDMHKVGTYGDRWSSEFKRWDGVVTLKNIKE